MRRPPANLAAVRHVLALAVWAMAAGATPATGAPTWERRAPLPVPSGGLVAGAVAGDIVIAGGTQWQGDEKRWSDRIWIYNTADDSWRAAGVLAAPVAYAVTGQGSDSLWIAGGAAGSATRPEIWRLDGAAHPRTTGRLDPGVVYAAGALLGSTLYVIGGTDTEPRLDRASAMVRAIDVTTGVTVRLADYPGPGVILATAVATGDRLFVFGGARWDANRGEVANLASANTYAATADRWTSLPSLPTANRGITGVPLDSGRIFLAGGFTDDADGFTANTWCYDIETRRYTAGPPLPYRGLVALVKCGEWLYCLGGEDRKRHRSDAVWRIRWAELLPPAPTREP